MYRYVCIPCREVYPGGRCRRCGSPTKLARAHGGWAPPKKNNDRAWRMIEKGDWLWDKKRVTRIQLRHWPEWKRLGDDYYFNLKRSNKKFR